MLRMENKDILENYKQTLKDLQQLQNNLSDKSNNYVKKELLRIIERGWGLVETMYDIEHDNKERLQKQFNEMLRLAPMTRIDKTENDNT